MHKFNDNRGREWLVKLTFGAVKRVKELLSVDLLDPVAGNDPLLTKIGTDIAFLCDLIFVLVKPQADEANISDVEFGESLGGDAIAKAASALYEELIDFFRELGRKDVAQAVVAQLTLIEKVINQAEKRITTLDIDKLVNESMPGSLYTSLPES